MEITPFHTITILLVTLFATIVLAPTPVLVVCWYILQEMRRIAAWSDGPVPLPDVPTFDEWELLHSLLHAARLEFPDKRARFQTVMGRRKGFSRYTMAGWMGRDRFETLRDALTEQGYLVQRGKRYSCRWTNKGRLLLLGVMSGRYGDLTLKIPPDTTQWRDMDKGDRLYTVDTGE
jgi:hypothetical protein